MKSMCKTLIGRIAKFASLHPKKGANHGSLLFLFLISV